MGIFGFGNKNGDTNKGSTQEITPDNNKGEELNLNSGNEASGFELPSFLEDSPTTPTDSNPKEGVITDLEVKSDTENDTSSMPPVAEVVTSPTISVDSIAPANQEINKETPDPIDDTSIEVSTPTQDELVENSVKSVDAPSYPDGATVDYDLHNNQDSSSKSNEPDIEDTPTISEQTPPTISEQTPPTYSAEIEEANPVASLEETTPGNLAEEIPVEEKPVEEIPVEEAAPESPAEEMQVEEKPAEEIALEKPVEEIPVFYSDSVIGTISDALKKDYATERGIISEMENELKELENKAEQINDELSKLAQQQDDLSNQSRKINEEIEGKKAALQIKQERAQEIIKDLGADPDTISLGELQSSQSIPTNSEAPREEQYDQQMAA